MKSCFSDWLEMFWSRRGWIVWISVDTYFIVTLILYNKVPLFLYFLFKTPIRLQTKHFTHLIRADEYGFERITHSWFIINLWFNELVISTSMEHLWQVTWSRRSARRQSERLNSFAFIQSSVERQGSEARESSTPESWQPQQQVRIFCFHFYQTLVNHNITRFLYLFTFNN